MREFERRDSLRRSPRLLWDILMRDRYDFTYDQMPVSLRHMPVAKRLNLVRAGGNLVYRRPTPWAMPLHMQFELTNYCNLSCPVCPTGAGQLTRRPKAMDVDLFASVMEHVGPYLLTASLWGWGESALHKELRRFLKIASAYPVATFFSTNGQNLDDENLTDALLEAPPTHLIVAIDGLSDETNPLYRIGAKLAPPLAGVRRLAELKRSRGQTLPILHMRMIALRQNAAELDRAEEWARAHGFEFLSIRGLLTPAGLDSAPYAPALNRGSAQGQGRDDPEPAAQSDFVCQQPFWFPTLFADGTLVACEQDYNADEPLGVIDDRHSFRDVWRSAQAARVRSKILDPDHPPRFCQYCPYADCATSSFSVQGTALEPRPLDSSPIPTCV